MAAAQREFWIGLVGDSQELFEQLGGTITETKIKGVKEQRFQGENGLTLCFYHFLVKSDEEASILLAGHFMRQNIVIFGMKKLNTYLTEKKDPLTWDRPFYQGWFNVLLAEDFGEQGPLVVPALVDLDIDERDIDSSKVRLDFLLQCLKGSQPVNPYSSPTKRSESGKQGKDKENKLISKITPRQAKRLNEQVQPSKVFQSGNNESLFSVVTQYANVLFQIESLGPEIIPKDYPAQCNELTQGKNADDAAKALFGNYISHWDRFLRLDWWGPYRTEVMQALNNYVHATAPGKYNNTGYIDPLEQFIDALKKINVEPKAPLLEIYIQYYEEKFLVPRRAQSSTSGFFTTQDQNRGRTLGFDFDDFSKRRAPSPTPVCSFGPFGRKSS